MPRRRAPRQPADRPGARAARPRAPSSPSIAVGQRACGRPRRSSVAAVLQHWSHDDGRLPEGRLLAHKLHLPSRGMHWLLNSILGHTGGVPFNVAFATQRNALAIANAPRRPRCQKFRRSQGEKNPGDAGQGRCVFLCLNQKGRIVLSWALLSPSHSGVFTIF